MRKFVYVCTFLLLALHSLAQEKRISGRVTRGDINTPVAGATVALKGSSVATQTAGDGTFSINAPSAGSVLVISFVGMETTEVVVGDQSTVSVALRSVNSNLEEVVVTGYSTERKKDITGAVSVVNLKETLKETNANILTSLQGRVPGLTIESDGTPGGNGTSIRIRGFSTTGANGPLFVIDGVPTTYSGALNPADIESVQVLKDASSASIYGSRANNGVIIITTRKGKDQKARVTLSTSYGIQTMRDKIEMLNAQEWGNVFWNAQKNSGLTPSHPQYGSGATPVIPQFIDPAHNLPAGNTDWINQITRTAPIQVYNLGVSQATGKSNYYLGMSYNNDQGIVKYTGYDRFTMRFNSSFDVSNRITIGENIMVSHFRETKGNTLYDAILQHPLVPVYDNLGNFGGPTEGLGDKLNPLGQLFRNKDNQSKNWRVFGNVFATATLAKGLILKTSFGLDYNNFNLKAFTPRFVEGRFNIQENFLTVTSTNGYSWTWSNTLNYIKKFGDHSLELLGGVEAIKNTSNDFSSSAKNFLLDDYNYVALSNGTVTGSSSGGTGNTLLSQFGRVNYNYAGRYLASATLRRDGSSRFGTENRYGIFPAFSAGWVISEEDFFKVDKINLLKFRGSWGKTGNQEIGDFNTLNFFKTSPEFANYDIAGANTSAQVAYYAIQLGNQNLKWESQTQTDFAVDVSAFNNRVTASVDYYKKTTSDLLINPVLLAVYGGANPPYINSGVIENKGVEIGLGYKSKNASPFTYGADLNLTFNKNRVTSLANGVPFLLGAEANRIVPGKPMSVFYGYVTNGIFQNQDEVDAAPAQNGKGVGRIRYKDLDGNKIIDDKDRDYIGNPQPKFYYGLNLNAAYKGFDASVFINGAQGNKLYNSIRKLTDFAYFPFNFGKATLNAWSTSNTGSGIPAVNVNNPNDELRASDYFVEDGSYLKIKSIQLGYTIPGSVLSRAHIEGIRVYVQAQNLATFTKYSGMDPEVGPGGPFNQGVDAQLYPRSRAINFGLNINF